MLAAPVQLVPNVALRNSIEEWAEKHAPWLLVGVECKLAGCCRRCGVPVAGGLSLLGVRSRQVERAPMAQLLARSGCALLR